MGCSSAKASTPKANAEVSPKLPDDVLVPTAGAKLPDDVPVPTGGASPSVPPCHAVAPLLAPPAVPRDVSRMSLVSEGDRSQSHLIDLPYYNGSIGGRTGPAANGESRRANDTKAKSTEVSCDDPPPQFNSKSYERSSEHLRTAALPVSEEKKLCASPFNSVPNEVSAKSNLFWKELPAEEFQVRSAGYGTTHKNKEPSAPALYNCVCVDVLKGGTITDLLHHKRTRDFTWWKDEAGAWDSSWGVPRILVVNCLLPIHNPVGWGKKPPGAAMVSYFRLSREACLDLAAGKVCPQMKQWKRTVKNGCSTRDEVSFKAIGQLPEKSLSELPQMLQGYNGKPVLVTDSAGFIKDMLPEVLEIDVDVGKWAFLARQTLYSYQSVLAQHAFHVGYLVEGRAEDELPESMLACYCISGADLAAAMDADK